MRILFWFRKDLRLDDNTGLAAAAGDAQGNVIPFYASEPEILSRPDIAATRVRFVLDSLADLGREIAKAGSRLVLDHGTATDRVVRAARAARVDAVYWNDEYEPQLRRRDDEVERALGDERIRVRRFHDRLLTPPGMVTTKAGTPFVVYTPFRRACEALPIPEPLPRITRLAAHDLPQRPLATLEQLGLETSQEPWPGGARAARRRLERFISRGLASYASDRDLPGAEATSRLSADLRFGTLSPRTVAAAVRAAAKEDRRLLPSVEKLLSELRWRDFYAHVLHDHPWVENGPFRRALAGIEWMGNSDHLEAWKTGRTGYPLVDAGMRQLTSTGFMHNRVRMVVASFLTKDLLLDWRLGERHFMTRLVDGDLASNNGGWQWAASTGTDAQPYFRVFNPTLQGLRYDPEGHYIRRWVPELSKLDARWIHRPSEAPERLLAEAKVVLGKTYPRPIVDHEEQRDRAIAMYRSASERA